MLEEKIVDLTAAVERLVAILSEQGKIVPNKVEPKHKPEPKVEPKPKPEPKVEPKPKPAAPKQQGEEVRTEDLKPILLGLAREGHRLRIRKKLNSYPVKKSDDLTAEQAEDFLSWLNTLEKK